MKKKVLVIIVLVIAAVLIGFFVFNARNTDDLPGSVIGPNPQNIPESELPVCNFTSFGYFAEEPCYSPPDAAYL